MENIPCALTKNLSSAVLYHSSVFMSFRLSWSILLLSPLFFLINLGMFVCAWSLLLCARSSPAAVSGGCSSSWRKASSLQWLLSWRSPASAHRLQWLPPAGSGASWCPGYSWTRGRTQVPAIAGRLGTTGPPGKSQVGSIDWFFFFPSGSFIHYWKGGFEVSYFSCRTIFSL